MSEPAYWRRVEEFVASIKTVPFFRPDGNPEPEWKLLTADSWNAARDAAWYAAWNAAWYASWYAARDASWYAARDAARDAKLMAGLSVCDGLQLAENHAEHIRARWRVWQKGYALLCDVNGVFYVYSANKRVLEESGCSPPTTLSVLRR